MSAIANRKLVGTVAIAVTTIHVLLLIWLGFGNVLLWRSFVSFISVLAGCLLAYYSLADRSAPPQTSPAPTQDFDRELRELEILSKRQELEDKRRESTQKGTWLVRWNNPVVLALLAALVGYLGTLITWSLARVEEAQRHTRTLELEENKQKAVADAELKKLQGTLILDMLRTKGRDKTQQAAVNLLLAADMKLVTLDEATRQKLEKWSRGEGGVGPGLPSQVPAPPDPFNEEQYGRIREDVAFVTTALNEIFERHESPPSVKPSEFGENAYFDIDARSVHFPPNIALYTPDVAYREVVHMYRPLWAHAGESGALGVSTADVLAAVVSQRRLKQTAETADWTLYGKLAPRSLKAPEVDNTSKMKEDTVPGSVYLNSGIPSKAFYVVASKIGTERAAAVWVKTLSRFTSTRPTFADFARESSSQAEALYGADARKAVDDAWTGVGVQRRK